MWCGKEECEDKIKEDVGITIRCIPFEQENTILVLSKVSRSQKLLCGAL